MGMVMTPVDVMNVDGGTSAEHLMRGTQTAEGSRNRSGGTQSRCLSGPRLWVMTYSTTALYRPRTSRLSE